MNKKNRKLDGIFFRVKRNGEWQSICLSDMTEEERNEVLKDKDAEFLRRTVNILAETIADIGEQLDITRD